MVVGANGKEEVFLGKKERFPQSESRKDELRTHASIEEVDEGEQTSLPTINIAEGPISFTANRAGNREGLLSSIRPALTQNVHEHEDKAKLSRYIRSTPNEDIFRNESLRSLRSAPGEKLMKEE